MARQVRKRSIQGLSRKVGIDSKGLQTEGAESPKELRPP